MHGRRDAGRPARGWPSKGHGGRRAGRSLLRPSPTLLERWQSLPVVMGLILVCFAGHAVLPTLRNDMADRRQYGRCGARAARGRFL